MVSLIDRLTSLRRSYSPHDHQPLDGYLVAVGSFGLLAAGLTAAGRAVGDVPARPAGSDVVLIAIATHKLSRLLAKDAVTSPIRAPFARYQEPAGAAELNEEVRDQGSSVRHAVGELITCPFCLAVWVATALTGSLVLAPRLTRLAATVFTATAASDFLQLAYDAAKGAAGEK